MLFGRAVLRFGEMFFIYVSSVVMSATLVGVVVIEYQGDSFFSGCYYGGRSRGEF